MTSLVVKKATTQHRHTHCFIGWLKPVVIFFIQNVITVWCYSLRDIDFWSVGARSVVEGTKGQLISKCLFAVFNFLQKTNEKKSTRGFR